MRYKLLLITLFLAILNYCSDSTTSPDDNPYKSAKVFILADEVYHEMEIYFQDIDLTDSTLIFHPSSSFGLYEYNFSTEHTSELVVYGAGDCIAQDSIFVFWDYGTQNIFRYNYKLDFTDLEFNLSSLNYNWITGLECWQNKLYVLFRATPQNFIGIFDYNGNFISSIPFQKDTYFLAIYDNVLYTHDYRTVLSRFDLNTSTFLDDKILPTDDPSGIRIYKDKFYYIDWGKRLIGEMQLSEFE